MDSPEVESSAAPRRGISQIVFAGLFVLFSVGIALWTALYLTGGLHDPADWVIEGITLGMTPSQTEAAFKAAPYGEWETKPGCDGLAYEWTRKPGGERPKTDVSWARLEFHEGLLVAYRVKLDHPTHKHLVEVMSAAVREERTVHDGETIVMLSRVCPTHHAEAEQIAASRR